MINKSVALLIYSNRDINTYPYVTNTAMLLSENGFEVDVYMPALMKTSLKIPGCRFIVVSTQKLHHYVLKCVSALAEWEGRYDFVFAYQYEPLVVMYLLSKQRQITIPTIYFSLELVYSNYPMRLIRWIVRSIVRRDMYDLKYYCTAILVWIALQGKYGKHLVKLSIVQDKLRGLILSQQYRFAKAIRYVPNSYIGFRSNQSDYAYKRFRIPHDKKILLFCGGVEKGFDLNIFDVLGSLPAEYVTIFNCYSRDNYLESISYLWKEFVEKCKIIINMQNLSDEDYDELVRSCYIGIVWYSKEEIMKNDNMYYLGLSSGKMNKLLSCGKPVVTIDYAYAYHELVDENNLGRTCSDSSLIRVRINEIEGQYSLITKSIEKYYLEQLEFYAKFKQVIDELILIAG